MKVWIDIYHIPQFNFYLPFMRLLAQNGHQVALTMLNRGKLSRIVKADLAKYPELNQQVEIYVIGKHGMTRSSAIWNANLIRIVQLGWWRWHHFVEVSFSNGFQAALWSRIFKNKSYTFGDDPNSFDYKTKKIFASQVYYCIANEAQSKDFIVKYPSARAINCLKEWAYLNPRTFVPNEKVLEMYGVKPKEYMFLREVTVGTINYAGQESGAILGIKDMIPTGMKVLFSLEEKKRRSEYPADWILLQEPIEDIHSLIYYAAGLVSSGDSMAREAALLGVPSYYLGIRYSMPANAAASKVASLQNRKTMDFEQWIQSLPTDVKECEKRQQELRNHIDREFIDINEYMLALVEKCQQDS